MQDKVVEGDLALLEQHGGEGAVVALQTAAKRDVHVRQKRPGQFMNSIYGVFLYSISTIISADNRFLINM
jgi:hypothetical protein